MPDPTFGPPFDADELLHLAAHASSMGNPHAAMAHLKELLRREPQHARAIYLIGAQYALIGLHERAASRRSVDRYRHRSHRASG